MGSKGRPDNARPEPTECHENGHPSDTGSRQSLASPAHERTTEKSRLRSTTRKAAIEAISRQATEEISQVNQRRITMLTGLAKSRPHRLRPPTPCPLTPIVQCCMPNVDAPTCEISAVQTPPALHGLDAKPPTLNFGGRGCLVVFATCSKTLLTYLTCEISSVVSHVWHGFRADKADAPPTTCPTRLGKIRRSDIVSAQ